MQKCSSCGTEFPENSRFCGTCGSVQDVIATDAATTRSPSPQWQSGTTEDSTILATRPPDSNGPVSGSDPAWFPYAQGPITPPPLPAAENEDERSSDLPPWSLLYDVALGGETLLGSGQVSTPGAPVVQGTPQATNISGVSGTPSLDTNAPVSHPLQGPGNAPISHPMQGLGNAPVSHPMPGAGNAPVSDPLQGAGNASVGQPLQGPGNAPASHPLQGLGNAPASHPLQGLGNAPVSQPMQGAGSASGIHPMQGPGNAPVSYPTQGAGNASYPQTGVQTTRKPPEQPGTQERQAPHKPHQHRTHRVQHTAERVTKTAGGSAAKTVMLVVAAVVVVAAGAAAAATHFFSHPQPLISITSNYKVGNAPAGASGTVLHISGQQFSNNSAITFLLDGQAAPGNPSAKSDSNGNLSADVTITNAWSVGTHTLTASDANNNTTKDGISVTVVQPGQANTPGPDGAPPDDASFKVIAQIQAQNQGNTQETEIVTGHPDPTGGTVCQPEDNGQPVNTTGTTVNTSLPYQETSTYSCTGSYKGGKLTLTETFNSDVIVLSLSDGTTSTCTLNSPQIDEQLSGSYTGNNTFSGTITYPSVPASDYSCNGNAYFYHVYEQNNWTGQVTDLQS